MNIEQQVVSLDLAKRLKELNVKQESLFWWSICHDCEKEYPEGSVKWDLSFDKQHGENISAFTVAELGEMLPDRAYSFRGDYEHKWECTIDLLGDEYYTTSGGDTEADARAKLLIYLLENGLMEVPK